MKTSSTSDVAQLASSLWQGNIILFTRDVADTHDMYCEIAPTELSLELNTIYNAIYQAQQHGFECQHQKGRGIMHFIGRKDGLDVDGKWYRTADIPIEITRGCTQLMPLIERAIERSPPFATYPVVCNCVVFSLLEVPSKNYEKFQYCDCLFLVRNYAPQYQLDLN
jgi:hypothetical protein